MPAVAAAVVPAPQVNVEHAIAPGSAGAPVRDLAQLLETLGHQTFISLGDNPEAVFTDALLAQVKRELTAHHSATASTDELPQLLRDVALIGEVDGATWQLLRQRAAGVATA